MLTQADAPLGIPTNDDYGRNAPLRVRYDTSISSLIQSKRGWQSAVPFFGAGL